MSAQSPPATLGLCHLALAVRDLEACERFYVDVLGMRVEWRPDANNVYLTSGTDNLALHRAAGVDTPSGRIVKPFPIRQDLDHIGFVMKDAEAVDVWHRHLMAHGVVIHAPPRTHRDGARSLYCRDPEGRLVQLIYHPPLSDRRP
ncbi:MAG: VOC family protein [Gammaproteobacteria bacterium]